jgi:hypothetical protein
MLTEPIRRGLRLSLVLLLGLAACQPAPATESPQATSAPAAEPTNENTASPNLTPQGEAGDVPWFTVDPVAVTPALDDGHTAAQVIGPAGGTLTATGADGAAFSLTIPEGSLIGPTVISMTPVSALDNLPLSGGLAAGVQLEPDSLWLMLPATLVITPTQALAPESQDYFAYRGAGDDWHAYPPLTSTAALALSVQHFSGYGVGSGSEADRAQQTGQAPSDAMAQIEAAIAGIFRQEKEAQATTGHGMPDFYERLNAQILRAFEQVVQPTAEAALESDDYEVVAAAIKVMLSWERFAALVDPDMLAPEMVYTTTVMEELVLRAVSAASTECAEQHNYERITTLFQLERTLALMGATEKSTALQKLKDCMHFELTFYSVMTEGGFGDPYGYRYELKATVPLALPPEDEFIEGRLVGSGPLEYVSVAWIGSECCSFAADGVDGVLDVRDGVNGVPFPFTPNAATMEIIYDPGMPAEAVTMSCPGVDPLSWETNAWKGYFDIMHTPEKIEASYRLVTAMLGGDIIARSQQRLTSQGPSGQEVIEDTLIQIVHKPVR